MSTADIPSYQVFRAYSSLPPPMQPMPLPLSPANQRLSTQK